MEHQTPIGDQADEVSVDEQSLYLLNYIRRKRRRRQREQKSRQSPRRFLAGTLKLITDATWSSPQSTSLQAFEYFSAGNFPRRSSVDHTVFVCSTARYAIGHLLDYLTWLRNRPDLLESLSIPYGSYFYLCSRTRHINSITGCRNQTVLLMMSRANQSFENPGQGKSLPSWERPTE